MAMNCTVDQAHHALYALLAGRVTGTADLGYVQYQGTGFKYPCLRYWAALQPTPCGDWDAQVLAYGWAEGDDPRPALALADEVVAAVHQRRWSHDGVLLQAMRVTSVPRLTRQDRLWRSEVGVRCLAT